MSEEDATQGATLRSAEQSVLAAMLLDRVATAEGLVLLRATQFHRTAHRAIFEAIASLHEQDYPADMVTVVHELEARGALEAAGGAQYVAQCFDAATTTANLGAHARIVREHDARRRARAAARRLEQLSQSPTEDLGETITAALADLTLARDSMGANGSSAHLVDQVISGDALLAAEIPPLDSLIGKGLIVRGGLSLVVGHSGLGKTFLAMQMMRAIALGDEFMGHQAQLGRVGMLQLEMPPASIQERLRSGINGVDYSHNTDWLMMPRDLGPITEPRTQDELCRWIEKRNLCKLVMDPLHAIHQIDENRGPEAGLVLKSLERVRGRTGVHIMLLHHVNKIQAEKGTPLRTAVLMSIRGSGRWTNDPETILGLVETQGRVRLVFAKTRHCSAPEFIDLKQVPGGYFERTDTPQEQADHTAEKIIKALEFGGDQGATLADLMRLTLISRATIQRHLGQLEVGEVRGPRGVKRYYLPELAPAENASLGV